MGFLGVKTYRKRLTGAVRSFLSYSEVISGRFGEKQFFHFFRPLFGPISNHIGPNLTLSGTKSPNLCMYMSCCLIWHHRLWSCDEHLFLRPIYPYIFDICFWIPGIYGPGIHVYLSTRYLWVSVDQISMDIWWPDIYEYLWFFFLPEGKAVAKFLIAIPVLAKKSRVTFGDS